MSERLRVHLLVAGRVQGVAYRAYTVDEARSLGLSGWCRNLPDGRVEIEAEGAKEAVEALVAWCRRGPPAARVEGVEVERSPYKDDLGPFTITR